MDNLLQTLHLQSLEKERLLGLTVFERHVKPNFIKLLPLNLIKVILGPRRSGKSTLAIDALRTTDFFYLNFEDENLININGDDLIKAIDREYNNPKLLLLDEIQNFAHWEMFLNKLQRRGKNLVITGSNSKLLSGEMATSLGGRTLNFEVLPFGFKEIGGVWENKMPKSEILKTFLINGGFPEFATNFPNIPSVYLKNLLDTTLLKDVINRHKIRKTTDIADFLALLITSMSCPFTLNSARKGLVGATSPTTLKKYFGFLEEAYIVFQLQRFSFKTKERINAPRKIYVIDNGLVVAKLGNWFGLETRLFENLAFLEIYRQGLTPNLDLFYYQTKNNREIDFIIKEGNKIKKLIQISFDISAPTTKEREFDALIEASQELACDDLVVVTFADKRVESYHGKTIKVIGIDDLA